MRVRILLLTALACKCLAFTVTRPGEIKTATRRQTALGAKAVSRRFLFQSVPLVAVAGVVSSQPVLAGSSTAKDVPSLESLLYTILRVKEAAQQESRLITSGKFKDVQRANVKLAVKFMVNNYRLSDTFIAASAYIDDTNRRIAAGDVGQATVQNLYTILEYFDTSDVQNIKVGQDSMAGKTPLVLKGLETARQNIDEFLTYFPPKEVDAARERLLTENEENKKEWDPALGDIFNLSATPV